MNRIPNTALALAALAAATALPFASAQQEPTALEIIQRIEDLMRSDRSYAELTMEIITPDWQRTVTMRSYDDREGERSFIHILSPRRDENTTFLRVEFNLWMYLPRAERTIRIPPSMMLNSWMGSDFTNDDLVRESSYIDDYDHELTGIEELEELDAIPCYHIVMRPKPDAPVTWGWVEVWISVEPLLPVLYRYYNQRGELRKEMIMSEIGEMDGHLLPTVWTMRTMDKPGHSTVIRLESMDFDADIPDRVFTRQHLRNPR